MFHLKDRRSFGLQLSFSRVVVSCHAVVVLLLLLLPRRAEGQPLVIGPSKPVVAVTGDDVILPCHLEPAVDAVSMAMEWTRPDLNPRFVHVRRGGHDLLENQHPAYEGRTSASIGRLKDGNVSLKLSRVKLSDAGTYRCFFPLLDGDTFVQLVVGAVSSPVIVSVSRVSDKVALQCESAGWYPEPEVLWLDAEGHLVSAGPPETVRGPDDLYTVSSRVTVDKRHGNSFTCRVQQRSINRTTETHITVSEDVFAAPSSAAVRVTIVSSVCVCAALLVLWKLRQSKGENKKHHDNESVDGAAEEEEQLLNTKDLSEEHKDMEHVIKALMEEKTELETSRDKLETQLEEVKEEKKKNEKRLDKLDKMFDEKKQDKKLLLSQNIVELDNKKLVYRESLQRTKEKLEKTEDMIERITEWKKKVENRLSK